MRVYNNRVVLQSRGNKKTHTSKTLTGIIRLPTTVFAQGHQPVGCRAKAKAFKNTRSGF
jgi:hypothetical protein